jgi:hypothetical protein
MCPVPPFDALDVEESHVRLVDERRGLQRVFAAFATHVTACDTPQLVVHERDELVECGLIAPPPGQEQRGWTRRLFQNALMGGMPRSL